MNNTINELYNIIPKLSKLVSVIDMKPVVSNIPINTCPPLNELIVSVFSTAGLPKACGVVSTVLNSVPHAFHPKIYIGDNNISCDIIKQGGNALLIYTPHNPSNLNILAEICIKVPSSLVFIYNIITNHSNIVINDFVDYLVCIKDNIIVCGPSHDTARISVYSLINPHNTQDSHREIVRYTRKRKREVDPS